MESWRKCFREGLLPLMGEKDLLALKAALEADDAALIQGATTEPPPSPSAADWPCEGACLLGYVGWKSRGLRTVAEVEQFFADLCAEIDRRLGEPAGVRWLLNPFDEWPRDEMRRELLAEVSLALLGGADTPTVVTA